MIGEHGGLGIPKGTLAWVTSAPPASTGSGCVRGARYQMIGDHGGLVTNSINYKKLS